MNSRKLFHRAAPHRLASCIFAVVFLASWVSVAQAQLGSGWTQISPTKKIHLDDEDGLQTFNWTSYKSVCSGSICADYDYDSGTDTETFRIFDSRSNRSEIRLQNEYSTGRRQFQGYVTFYSPLHDESLFQIFGSTSGATLCMMRGDSSSGGKLRVVGGIGDIETNCYGVEKRINVIHDQNNFVQFYVNGSLKGQFSESEAVSNYWKYGVYGTTNGNVPAIAEWRAVRCYRDGQPPGSGGGLDGNYRLMARHSGKAAVVQSASTSSGANVFQWSYTSSTPRNDEWEVISVGSGYYRIMNRHSGQALAVQGASTSNGANVRQWPYDSSHNHHWAIESVGGGYYRIVNRNSGKVLDVYQAGTGNGVNIQQWDWSSGGNHKQFQLTSVP